MFGIYRTLLAIMVMAQHTFGTKDTGGFAVHAFFCLSGFLMTLLICETYRERPFDFAINRFLRLYPAYWFVAGATALWIAYWPIPEMIGKGPWNWGLPTELLDILRNVTFLAPESAMRLVPTSWAVTNELVFYAIIAAGATLTLNRSLLCLIVSLTATVVLIKEPRFYFSPIAAALSFSVGAVLYHLRKLPAFEPTFKSPSFPAAVIGAALVFGYFRDNGLGGMPALYLNMIVSAPLILWLFEARPSGTLKRWDDWIGTLSYPIYLVHFLPRIIITQVPPFWVRTEWFPWAVVALSIIFAIVIAVCVDKPIEVLRKRFRNRRPVQLSSAAILSS